MNIERLILAAKDWSRVVMREDRELNSVETELFNVIIGFQEYKDYEEPTQITPHNVQDNLIKLCKEVDN